jgi:hypothetical protein
MMLGEFRRVALFVADPGWLFRLDRTRVHYEALRRRYGGDRVQYVLCDAREQIREVLLADPLRDLRAYGFNLTTMICLGCRLSMHARAIIHCLETGTPYLADGSTRRQAQVSEQLESVLDRHRRFYSAEFGVVHASPIYEEGRSDRRLHALGISENPNLKRQFILYDTQPTCPFGVPADVYAKIFYEAMGDQRERDAERYCAEKYPALRDAVRRRFAGRGQDVDALIGRLREKAAADHGAGERARAEAAR